MSVRTGDENYSEKHKAVDYVRIGGILNSVCVRPCPIKAVSIEKSVECIYDLARIEDGALLKSRKILTRVKMKQRMVFRTDVL